MVIMLLGYTPSCGVPSPRDTSKAVTNSTLMAEQCFMDL
jgi:hypothetical protein